MKIKMQIKQWVKDVVIYVPLLRNVIPSRSLYRKYSRVHPNEGFGRFLQRHAAQIYSVSPCKEKAQQIAKLLRRVDICPLDSKSFFYSLDPYKTVANLNNVYGNYTVDISMLIKSDWSRFELLTDNNFVRREQIMVAAMKCYIDRCQKDNIIAAKYKQQFKAIESLFERSANSFFEALQRILFYNQFLWQTGHTLNGLGHLDWILWDFYEQDLKEGVLTRVEASELLKDFFRVLHGKYWFKSASLMGDTGQIVILGGQDHDGNYHCNDLTYLFIEVSRELKLPDPKVLLRCTADMPEDLLELAIDCISTGIGAPLLSNDDVVIPAMISCGYDETDAYNYGTSACWEPLIPGLSCDANNCASLNFAEPLIKMFETEEFEKASSTEEIVELYVCKLRAYICDKLTPLTKLEFEEDPLLSLVSPSSLERKKDITRGGAKYNNLGLTSVGLGCVVNSILNIKKLAFDENR